MDGGSTAAGRSDFRSTQPAPSAAVGLKSDLQGDEIELSAADRWILSRLEQTTVAVSRSIDNYRFDQMTQAIHEFTRDHYCDWYLELCKPVLTSEMEFTALRLTDWPTSFTGTDSILR